MPPNEPHRSFSNRSSELYAGKADVTLGRSPGGRSSCRIPVNGPVPTVPLRVESPCSTGPTPTDVLAGTRLRCTCETAPCCSCSLLPLCVTPTDVQAVQADTGKPLHERVYRDLPVFTYTACTSPSRSSLRNPDFCCPSSQRTQGVGAVVFRKLPVPRVSDRLFKVVPKHVLLELGR